MLLDLHACPHDLDPDAFAEAVTKAGLDGAVVALTNKTKGVLRYVEALHAADVFALAGVELAMDRGSVVYVPERPDAAFLDANWKPAGGDTWTTDGLVELLSGLSGVIIAGHPYCRALPSMMSDRVYRLPGLAAVTVQVGIGELAGDGLAREAAGRLGLAAIGTSGGLKEGIGRAATIFGETIADAAGLLEALEARRCWPVALSDMDEPFRVPEPPRRRDDRGDRDRRDDRRGGRDRGERRGGGRPRGRR
jgi:hypothetical protein